MKSRIAKIPGLTFIIMLLTNLAFGQDTLWVSDDDPRLSHQGNEAWDFNVEVPDGHYYIYYEGNKKNIGIELSFLGGKKEGPEYWYYNNGKKKYAAINWHKGKKNGPYIGFNDDGSIEYIFNFKDNALNGYCEVNYSGGTRSFSGYYKNGYRDSLWTFYTGCRDTYGSYRSQEWLYRNGKSYLMSQWDEQGRQFIAEGNSIPLKGLNYKPAHFLNGLKNGNDSFSGFYNEPRMILTFENGLMMKKQQYDDSDMQLSVSEWIYPYLPRADTTDSWVDNHITNIVYHDIRYHNMPVPNSYWMACYPNGIKKYEGNYTEGKRMGKWIWLYETGKPRIIADYTQDKWQHYDTSGVLKSTLPREFLSLLTDEYWFLNQDLDDTVITLSRAHHKTVTPKWIFHYDGKLEINDFLECGKDIRFGLHAYTLLADTLEIHTGDGSGKTDRNRTFCIVSGSESEIVLKRIR